MYYFNTFIRPNILTIIENQRITDRKATHIARDHDRIEKEIARIKGDVRVVGDKIDKVDQKLDEVLWCVRKLAKGKGYTYRK